ncbi:MAG: ABC transporter ATP-binding protein [Oscillospiraceae bacterium]|nr:ABC transporter ATP-binding protein [Oscillospiraceae bacterium]
MDNVLLKIEDLSLSYGGGLVAAGVTIDVRFGETLAVVGESGCGKTSLLKAVLGLADLGVVPEGGSIVFDGAELTTLPLRARKKRLGEEIGMIFQNPGAAFNPIRTYQKQFAEMLRSHGRFEGEKSYAEIMDCFAKLGLPEGERILQSCPYEMSGGMNQRIAIAAAMLLRPRLLLLDEPTSALDVTTQKTVVDELSRLKALTGAAMILVTHNLGVAARMAERTGVMYAGRLVEVGETGKVLKTPAHPYTKSLLAAVPKLDGRLPTGLDGQPPLHGAAMSGCAFFDRCPMKKSGCQGREYALTAVEEGHYACCTEGLR